MGAKYLPKRAPEAKCQPLCSDFTAAHQFYFVIFLSHIFSTQNEKMQHTDKPLMQKTTFI